MRCLFTILLCSITFLLAGQGTALRQEVRLDDVSANFDLSGAGVTVVMIDRGIDYEHPDFIDAQGNTRIAYLYDMIDPSGANAANNPFGIGTIFDAAMINNALANDLPRLSHDRFGHGTATTGIMCGNGSGTNDGQFAGVAPEATIIAIKITHDFFPPFDDQPGQDGFFDPTYISVALQFAQDKIAELNQPSVTLLNIGSIGGPTDGTSSVSQAIDAYVAAGHPFLCGVGDDGGADNYATATVAAGATSELEISKGEAGFLRLDLWYPESDRLTVRVERPDGSVVGPFAPPNGPGAGVDQNLSDLFIGHRGADVEFFGASSERRELLIDFRSGTGVFTVILENTGSGETTYQATLNPSIYSNANRFLNNIGTGTNINDYSSSVGAISPGDYVVDNTWTDIDGISRGLTGQGMPGELWIGSSVGPTQSGAQGIDFVAPGEVAFGAYSPNTWYSNSRFNLIQGSNERYGIQNAVSAAAPLTAGVIALMLEVNPDLTPEEVRSILQASCVADSFTGAVPNNQWGFGKLDAFLAIENTIQTTSVESILASESEVTVFPNPFGHQLTLQLQQPQTVSQVALYNPMGQQVWATEAPAQPMWTLKLPDLPAGLYTLLIHTEAGLLKKRIIRQ